MVPMPAVQQRVHEGVDSVTARDVGFPRRGAGGEPAARVLAGHTRSQITRATTALFDIRQTHLTDYDTQPRYRHR
jgi:hypothetical protein